MNSDGCCESAYCGFRTDAATKYRKCMGWKDDWCRQCHRLSEVCSFLSDRLMCSGYIDLPRYLPPLGETQFQILCVLGPTSLVITVIITCVAIKEVDPALLFTFPGQESEDKGGIQTAISVRHSISCFL